MSTSNRALAANGLKIGSVAGAAVPEGTISVSELMIGTLRCTYRSKKSIGLCPFRFREIGHGVGTLEDNMALPYE